MYAAERVHTTFTSRTRSRTARHPITPVEFLIIILAISFLLLAATSGKGTRATTGIETSTVRVKPNQSLWGIALEHPVEGLTTAQAVDLIREVNAMETSRLRAGQLLEVPAPQKGPAWFAAR